MNTQIDKTKIVKIRPAYLSDLHTIKSIYRELNREYSFQHILLQTCENELTEDFGVPVAVAEYKKEIIGYACIIMNPVNQSQTRQFCKKEYKDTEIEQQLNEYAKKILCSMYEKNKQYHYKLNSNIERFILWLNRCH
jgi:hypothetical protein